MVVDFAILFLTLVAGTMATPLARSAPRQIPTPCIGLGEGGFDIAFNFTLAALNVTLPNVNLTGVPLVLGENGATEGAEFEVLSVRPVATSWYTDSSVTTSHNLSCST